VAACVLDYVSKFIVKLNQGLTSISICNIGLLPWVHLIRQALASPFPDRELADDLLSD